VRRREEGEKGAREKLWCGETRQAIIFSFFGHGRRAPRSYITAKNAMWQNNG
jgi:hypothetical protein